MKYLCGNYHDMVAGIAESQQFPLSLLSGEWPVISSWQSVGRARVMELLGLSAGNCAMNALVEKKYERDGLIVELISYGQPFGPRTEGLFLRPAGITEKLPGILALHDHGAFKYFGKEKLVELDDEPEILTEFKKENYEGRSWATLLARRGYAVFVPDLFMWGSRRLDIEHIPDEFTGKFNGLKKGTREYIEAYNDFTGNYETIIAKSLFLAGSSWAGIMVNEDRRALDYLASRPEVDTGRLGCGGLSCGGLRSIYLAAVDQRIRCVFVAGFMSTNAEIVKGRIHWHTWMMHVPALASLMDMPDILSLHGDNPVMVLYNTGDPLWTLDGQRAAHNKLCRIYEKMGAAGKYQGKFYPGAHKFDVRMQEDTFDFFDKWFK